MADTIEDEEIDEELEVQPPVDEDFLQNLTLAQIHYPDIAPEIREFKRLTKRSSKISERIDNLKQTKESVDDDLRENAETIRDHIYNV